MSFWSILFINIGCGKSLQIDSPPVQQPVTPPSQPKTVPEPEITAASEYDFQLPSAKNKLPDSLKKKWPPTEWSSAKAYSFNMIPYRPGLDLYIYKDGTWNDKIAMTKDIDSRQAQTAISLVHRTAGDVKISKCPFPRHGVVFFDDEENPVASLNVCFQCGDILVWPPYLAQQDEKIKYQRSENPPGPPQIIPVYSEVFPIWEEYFYTWIQLTKDPYE